MQPTRKLIRAALIAALYMLLTLLLQPISFGAIQFRLSEALMLLPVFAPEAVPGLAAGCLLANLLGGGVWFDVIFGALATLLAAICVRRLRARPWLGAAATVIVNALIVGPAVYFGYVHAPGAPVSIPALIAAVGTVALGEAAACFALGLPLTRMLRRLPADFWESGAENVKNR